MFLAIIESVVGLVDHIVILGFGFLTLLEKSRVLILESQQFRIEDAASSDLIFDHLLDFDIFGVVDVLQPDYFVLHGLKLHLLLQSNVINLCFMDGMKFILHLSELHAAHLFCL